MGGKTGNRTPQQPKSPAVRLEVRARRVAKLEAFQHEDMARWHPRPCRGETLGHLELVENTAQACPTDRSKPDSPHQLPGGRKSAVCCEAFDLGLFCTEHLAHDKKLVCEEQAAEADPEMTRWWNYQIETLK